MSGKSRWWQTTVRQKLWWGCGFVVVGVTEPVLAGTGRFNPVRLGLAAASLAIGLAYFASAVAMRRRQRSSSAQDAHPTMRDSDPPPSHP